MVMTHSVLPKPLAGEMLNHGSDDLATHSPSELYVALRGARRFRAEVAVDDSLDKAERFLDGVVGNRSPAVLRRAFLESGPQAIATLEALTKPFITLSTDDKNSLFKMGDKSVAFCQQTALVLAQNKDALPAGFDYTEMEDDLAAYAALQSRVLRIREVLAKMDDTQTALGSDVMVAASEGYALMKLFGKAEGLSELKQAMRVRRPGRRRKGDAAA